LHTEKRIFVSSPQEKPLSGELLRENEAKLRQVHPEWRPFFAMGLQLSRDTSAINDRLIASKRPDLIMYRPVEVLDIKSRADIALYGFEGYIDDNSAVELDKGNNFFRQFIIKGNHGSRPLNKEELAAIARGTYVPQPYIGRPTNRPAYERMLNIPEFRDFAEELTLHLSRLAFEDPSKIEILKAINSGELFIAYQLMRNMVCMADEGALCERGNGAVEERHLTI
jgi:hypothetical protein